MFHVVHPMKGLWRLNRVLLVGLGVPLIAHADDCLSPGDAWAYPDTDTNYPLELSYEGPFPETSQGASIHAFLDDDRTLRAAKIEYYGETGKAVAVFVRESAGRTILTWIDEYYREPIYFKPSPTVESTERSCFVVEGDEVTASPGARPGLGEALLENVRLGLAEYLPCRIDWPHGAMTEDGSDALTATFLQRIEEGQRLLAAGRVDDALTSLREADSLDLFEVPSYEAPVHIAEAQCQAGAVAEGLATLANFRCAVAVDAGELPCYVGEVTLYSPGQRNPETTDVCFERMCGELFLRLLR